MSTHRIQVTPKDQAAKTVRPLRAHARRQRQYALVISLCTLVTIACLTMITSLSAYMSIRASLEPPISASNPIQDRMGTIVQLLDGDRCKQMKFDNDSGRTVESLAPCDNEVVLGRVDGFDQDKAKCESDKRTVIPFCFLAA